MTDSINWGALIDESKDAFEPLPIGKYTTQVVKAEATRSSTDKLMYKVTFQVAEGPKKGSNVFSNITLTPDNPKAVYMFLQNLKALGIQESYLKSQPSPPPEMVAAKMVGARVTVEIEHRPYQGVVRENVKSMTSAGQGGGVGAVPTVGGAPIPVPAVAAPATPSVPIPTAPAEPADEGPQPTF